LSLQPYALQGTVGGTGQTNTPWEIKNRIISLRSISIANETRPQADPRPCWVDVLRFGADEGICIAFGNASSYNDFVKTYGQGFTVGYEDTVLFCVRGESGDVFKINVLYKVIKLGQ
jgi:hypothetical protein